METKKVILKCRFGNHLPNPHKAVEIPIEAAGDLIGLGLASEPIEAVLTGGSELEAKVEELTATNTALGAKVEELTATNTALGAKVEELEAIIAAVNTVSDKKDGGKR